MHEIDNVIFAAKHLAKLEDEQLRRERIGVITAVLGIGYLSAAGISGITNGAIPVDSLVKLTFPVVVGSGYGILNLLRLFKVGNEIGVVKSELTEMGTESIDYEKPKREKFILGDDGELVEEIDGIYRKGSQVNH